MQGICSGMMVSRSETLIPGLTRLIPGLTRNPEGNAPQSEHDPLA